MSFSLCQAHGLLVCKDCGDPSKPVARCQFLLYGRVICNFSEKADIHHEGMSDPDEEYHPFQSGD